MLIATYNVNSINARLENLLEWLKQNQPDVLLLQEIKTEFNGFPFFELQSAGYDAKILGQKSYNGVAVVSRHKLNVRQEGLPVLRMQIRDIWKQALQLTASNILPRQFICRTEILLITIRMMIPVMTISCNGWMRCIVTRKNCCV